MEASSFWALARPAAAALWPVDAVWDPDDPEVDAEDDPEDAELQADDISTTLVTSAANAPTDLRENLWRWLEP